MAVRSLSASTWQRAISFFRASTSSLLWDACHEESKRDQHAVAINMLLSCDDERAALSALEQLMQIQVSSWMGRLVHDLMNVHDQSLLMACLQQHMHTATFLCHGTGNKLVGSFCIVP